MKFDPATRSIDGRYCESCGHQTFRKGASTCGLCGGALFDWKIFAAKSVYRGTARADVRRITDAARHEFPNSPRKAAEANRSESGATMIDLRKRFAGEGYLITSSEHDTTNIVCRCGHIYADGDSLVASLDAGTLGQVRALKQLGTPVMDGDFGELSVRFPVSRFRDVARILKPRQAALAKRAA